MMDKELTRYFQGDHDICGWPYPLYDRIRSQGRVVEWAGGPAKLLTHYQDVRAAMKKELPLHNDGYRYGRLAKAILDRLPEESKGIFHRVFDFEALYLTRNEGECHQRLRGSIHRAFLARNINTLRESIQMHVDELIDAMARSDTPDWKSQVADRLPARVISDLFGVPQSDRDRLWNFAETIAAHFSMTESTLKDASQALDEFGDYVSHLIKNVRDTGEGTELTRGLIEAMDAGRLSEKELVAMLLVMLFGGTETTTNLLGNGFAALQSHRSEWKKLAENPERALASLDELLRYDNPLQYLPRYATETFEIDGHTIEEGETVITIIGAANRDAEIFPDPDRLDLDRENSASHLAFSIGPHFCIGAALARMESELAFTSLAKRFPKICLTSEPLVYRGSAMLRAIASLPVSLS